MDEELKRRLEAKVGPMRPESSELVWKRSNGDAIKIKDMPSQHISNSFTLLKRNGHENCEHAIAFVKELEWRSNQKLMFSTFKIPSIPRTMKRDKGGIFSI